MPFASVLRTALVLPKQLAIWELVAHLQWLLTIWSLDRNAKLQVNVMASPAAALLVNGQSASVLKEVTQMELHVSPRQHWSLTEPETDAISTVVRADSISVPRGENRYSPLSAITLKTLSGSMLLERDSVWITIPQLILILRAYLPKSALKENVECKFLDHRVLHISGTQNCRYL